MRYQSIPKCSIAWHISHRSSATVLFFPDLLRRALPAGQGTSTQPRNSARTAHTDGHASCRQAQTANRSHGRARAHPSATVAMLQKLRVDMSISFIASYRDPAKSEFSAYGKAYRVVSECSEPYSSTQRLKAGNKAAISENQRRRLSDRCSCSCIRGHHQPERMPNHNELVRTDIRKIKPGETSPHTSTCSLHVHVKHLEWAPLGFARCACRTVHAVVSLFRPCSWQTT